MSSGGSFSNTRPTSTVTRSSSMDPRYGQTQRGQKQKLREDWLEARKARDDRGINISGWGEGDWNRPEFIGTEWADYKDYMGAYNPYQPMMDQDEWNRRFPNWGQLNPAPTSFHELYGANLERGGSDLGLEGQGGQGQGGQASIGIGQNPSGYSWFSPGSEGSGWSPMGGGLDNLGSMDFSSIPVQMGAGGLDTQFWKDFSQTGRLNEGLLGDIQRLEAAPGLAAQTGFDSGFINQLDTLDRDIERIGRQIGSLSVDDLLADVADLHKGSFGVQGQLRPIDEQLRGITSTMKGLPDLLDLSEEFQDIETRMQGLGSFADFGKPQEDISELESRMSRLAGRGLTPEQISELEGRISPLETRMSDLASFGLTPDQIEGLEQQMVPLETRMSDLAGFGLTPDQITGLEQQISPLETRMRGLADLGLTDQQITGLKGRISPLERRMRGLADLGLTEQQITGLEGEMVPLERRMRGLADLGLTDQQITGLKGRISPLERRMRGLADFGLTDQQIAGLEGEMAPLERRMRGLADLGLTEQQITGLKGRISPLERRMSGLADFGLTEDQILGLEEQMTPLEDRMAGLADFGLTEDQILGLEEQMAPLETRMSRLAGRGLTPSQVLELERRMVPLEDRMSGLADFGLTESQIAGLEEQISPLERRMSGLADFGLTEDQILGLESQMAPLEDRMSGLADFGLTESQIAGLEERIDPLASRMAGLADLGLTDDQIKGLQSRIDPLSTRMSELADLADFSGPEAAIAGLGEDVADLGLTEVDFSGIEQQIKDLEDRAGGIGGTGETTSAGKVTVGSGEEGDAEVVSPASATGAAGYMDEIQEILTALAGADPMTVGEYDPVTGLAPAGTLRGDPITAALLSDLRDETEEAEKERIRQLQRMGVLKSGVNIDTGVDLDEARLRAEYDILGQAAERARADRELGLTRGIDLAGMEADLELATGEMLGRLGDEATIGGRQATLDSIASILAALDPELTSPGINKGLLSNAILNMTGISDEDKELFRKALGITEADQHRGTTEDDLITVVDGQVQGGNNSQAMQDFLEENDDIRVNRTYIVRDDEDKPVEIRMIATGQLLASWDSVEEKWKRNQ